MHKWLLFPLIGLSLLSLNNPALAIGESCSSLIEKGNANPPDPINDLAGLKTCLNNCDSLYQSLKNEGKYAEMIHATNYCKQSLNNLYFASVTQTITHQLDQETQQQNASAQQNVMARITELLRQQQQNNNQADNAASNNNSNNNEPGPSSATTPSQAPAQIIGPPDGVKW